MTTSTTFDCVPEWVLARTLTASGQRYRQMVCRCGGDVETLASTMLGLETAGRFGDQETLSAVVQVMLGWDAAVKLDNRLSDLREKFGS